MIVMSLDIIIDSLDIHFSNPIYLSHPSPGNATRQDSFERTLFQELWSMTIKKQSRR